MKNSNFVLREADRWISVQHARDIAEVSDSTIEHLVRSGELRGAQLRGRGKAWEPTTDPQTIIAGPSKKESRRERKNQ
jgi:hypothetical protein